MIDLVAVSRAAACFEPLSTSVTRLAGLVACDSADLAQIVEVVRYDQALTAALLRGANSAWSASRTEVTTVTDAVVRLGAGPVMALAMGANVKARFARAVPAYDLAEGELWSHSVAASLAAETLVLVCKDRLPVETATAALLHDVGKLIVTRFVDSADLGAIEAARELGATRMKAEAEALGVDHAGLGEMIARAWALPDALVAGIARHHAPGAAEAGRTTLIAYGVHLADVVAKVVAGGNDDNADLETFARATGELGLTADGYDSVCNIVAQRFAEVSHRFA